MSALELYKPEELRPLTLPLKAHLMEQCPALRTHLDAIRCTTDEARSRIWSLAGFSRMITRKDERWAATTEDLWSPDRADPREVRAWIAQREPDESRPMLFGLGVPEATLVLPWWMILDHLVPENWVWLAAPLDASWFIYDHYEEFLQYTQMCYDRIVQLALVRRFRVPRTGAIVEKPQYLIRYTEGDPWLSDKMPPEERAQHAALFEYLSARTGKPVDDIDVLPDDLARQRR